MIRVKLLQPFNEFEAGALVDLEDTVALEAIRKGYAQREYYRKNPLPDTSFFLNGDGKIDIYQVAIEIMKEYYFLTMRGTEEVLWYDANEGVYKKNGENKIKEECAYLIGEKFKQRHFIEILNLVQARTYIEKKETNPDGFLNLKNGIFSLKEKKLIPHSPHYYFTHQLPVFYNPDADCLIFKKFISEIVKENDVPIIQELFGYCLINSYFIQKAFLLVGGGANGKTTLLDVLTAMLGKENVSAIPLQALCSNRFSISNLNEKFANIFPDLPDKALIETGFFKALTGGDTISAEQKFKKPFEFQNTAKLIFSCNKIPETKDNTDAFFRRWIIINFPNTFEGKKADKNLIKKLTTKNEISGIFNWALEGLERLLEKQEFSYSETTEEVREKYERMSNSLLAFVKDCVEIDVNSFTTKEEFYNAYVEYCQEFNLPAKSKTVVGRELAEHVPITEVKPVVDGKQVKSWGGIRLK